MAIATSIVDAIVGEAGGSAIEICGLLFGDDTRIDGRQRCRNVAVHTATAFEIDPRELLAAHRAMRAGGPRLIGCYHSHPSGVVEPSPRDAEAAAPDGWLWLIATGHGFGVWRAVGQGSWHGRFEAVAARLG